MYRLYREIRSKLESVFGAIRFVTDEGPTATVIRVHAIAEGDPPALLKGKGADWNAAATDLAAKAEAKYREHREAELVQIQAAAEAEFRARQAQAAAAFRSSVDQELAPLREAASAAVVA